MSKSDAATTAGYAMLGVDPAYAGKKQWGEEPPSGFAAHMVQLKASHASEIGALEKLVRVAEAYGELSAGYKHVMVSEVPGSEPVIVDLTDIGNARRGLERIKATLLVSEGGEPWKPEPQQFSNAMDQ